LPVLLLTTWSAPAPLPHLLSPDLRRDRPCQDGTARIGFSMIREFKATADTEIRTHLVIQINRSIPLHPYERQDRTDRQLQNEQRSRRNDTVLRRHGQQR
jgi:hypothetical protein